MITEKDYSDNELSEISKFYDRIVKAHKQCDGSGMSFVNDDAVSDCICVSVFKYIKELIFANIPRKFWGVPYGSLADYFEDNESFKQLRKKLFYESGFFIGLPGDGKTALLSLIGKLAIVEGRFVFYITPENLLRFIRSEDILVDRIYASEIILLDGIEKYNRSAWSDGQIEFILRNLSDKGKIIYITSASGTKDELKENIPVGLFEFINYQIGDESFIDYKKKKKSLLINDFFEKKFANEAIENFTEILEAIS